MKKNIKWLILAVLLVGVLMGAFFLYRKFAGDYSGSNLVTNTPTTTEGADTTQQTQSATQQTYAAPDFTVLDSQGNQVRLSDFAGKPVVLNFWATWCYYCKVEMPDFQKAFEQYPDVQFLMLNATDGVQETMEQAKSYIQQQGFTFDVYYDTELDAVNTYRITGFPATFFIDEKGQLIASAGGMLDLQTLEKGISMITQQEPDESQ